MRILARAKIYMRFPDYEKDDFYTKVVLLNDVTPYPYDDIGIGYDDLVKELKKQLTKDEFDLFLLDKERFISGTEDWVYIECEYDLEAFTGIYDKNNEMIYEGDIIRSENGNLNKVVWLPPQFILEQKNGDVCDFIGDKSFEIVKDEKLVDF